jgi:outer membrane protein
MKNSFNKLIKATFALSFVLGALAISPAKAAGEVGIIDNVKILEQYPASIDAQKKIGAEREKLQNKLTELSKTLEAQLKDTKLSEAQKLQKRKEAKDSLEADKKKVDALTKSIRDELEGKVLAAISAEAKAQSLSMVVSKGIVFYGGKDITDSVIKRLK